MAAPESLLEVEEDPSQVIPNIESPTQKFMLRVFQVLDQAQSNHGIPHQDYSQYHHYCTNRLNRIRHKEEVRTTLVHNHKYVEGVSGRRHAYCPRPLPAGAAIHHENILWNVFFQAERAWAQACELQRGQGGKSTRHAVVQRRLNKAAKFSQQFAELADTCGDDISIKEAQSYRGWMQGNAALEKKDHATAYHHYRQSMALLLDLAAAAHGQDMTSPQVLAMHDLWQNRAETVLRPLVRYCSYEARDSLDPSELESHETKRADQMASASSILVQFQGKIIPLDAYKELAVLYLKMESQLKERGGGFEDSRFLQLLSDLDDALQLTQSEYSHYESLPAGPSVSSKRAELKALAGFFRYHKLSIWGQQQEERVKGLTDEAELVHVYDALLQNAQAMATFPVSQDTSSEDDPLWLEAQAHVVRIRAFRCYYLARLYETTLNGTVQQVLGLLHQARKLGKRAVEEIAACDMENVDELLLDLEELLGKIQASICRAEATWYLQSVGASTGTLKTNRPLWLRLDDFDSGSVLADVPPLPIPMPCKPVFYDIAWKYVGGDLPLEKINRFIEDHEPKRSSFFSWFSSR